MAGPSKNERLGPIGFLAIDKPVEWSSHDVVDAARRWLGTRRVGHLGTLDPLATGVLVLCVGAATRLAEYVQRMEKVYQAGIRLGARSDTDDADGSITAAEPAQPPDRAALDGTLREFLGDIEQVPPAYSAAKITGKRAYELARRGADVDLQPRRVTVHAIDRLAYEYPHLELEVRCGKGTYIRALARDLGERLGCGALVATLRRTRVGPFTSEDAVSLDAGAQEARARLLPVAAAVAELPRLELPAEEITRLRQGQAVRLRSPMATPAVEVAVFDAKAVLVAVARVDYGTFLVWPVKVLT